MDQILIEVCANSVASALAAQEGGAHRVELCDNLYEGGTTPSLGCLTEAITRLEIALHPIIRPRGGDFCYSDLEFEIMKQDITASKEIGCDGIVMGILMPDGRIDKERTAQLIQLSRPMSVTFHRAFDMTIDPYEALETLIELGVDTVLTSGQQNKALEGIELIAELVKQAKGRIVIMPGSGVNEGSITEIIERTGVRACHVTCRKTVQSQMQYRNPHVSMGGLPAIPEYEISVTDVERIRHLVMLANQCLAG